MRTRKMMLYVGMIASLTVGIFISGAGQQKVEAKTKVTYTLKKGTLTIKGKGAMPAKMKFRRNKKIKKVIIKKGVTSVSYEAFALCKNLNSVTIPSTVKTIGIRSFYGTKISKITVPSKTKTIGQGAFGSCKDLKTIVMPGDFKLKLEEDTDDKLWYVASDQSAVDTITFNTKLKLANVSYLSANNLVVAKNDPSYQSIEGVIYTKDGKGIVRVPQKRTELKIKEGCTEFNMQSVLYNSTDSEGDEFNNCSKLKKIVIPSSVKSINKIKYKTDRADACDMHVDTIEIAPKDFDANSLYALGSSLGKNITIESLMKLLPDQITYKDHMYITKDHGLLKYDGKDANVEIPEEITWIAPEAFYRNETLKNVKLPSKITTIEENTFYGCSELEAVIIPDQVTMIGKSAFDECTVLKSVTFGKSLKVIKDHAFASVNIRNFTIPSGIQKIETGAFAGINQIGTVTFEGSTKYVAADAFMNSTGIKLVYKKGIKEAQTELSYDYIIARKNGNNKVRTTWQPVSGANGYQLKFSTDKKFKKVLKTVMVKKNVSNATTYVKNKKKTLYIKVRPYQTINKKNVYGRWSYLQL
ncbi:leucine-rich repeat domain-containing protein [Anaerostipes hadrus]|uniref:leucine-rich repeat domain-containing protein n=1 Tax=Anaerostipes hadrus TaxID=649756 RepID=UPI001570A1BC|nr:leucine-rich repeat domain-containing protein [Anaerostipes hadrus]NSH00587.1 leucine-rich repeat domain-containing protein [Anaerostipes hadrus]